MSQRNPPKKTGFEKYFEMFLNAAALLGTGGTLILFIITILLVYGTSEQKRQAIDFYILLKFDESKPYQYYFVQLILLALLIGQGVFYKKSSRLKDARIKELEEQNSLFIKKLPLISNQK